MDGPINYDALAGSVRAEDVASNAENAALLGKIMKNDPDIGSLGICHEDGRDGEWEYDFCPADAREMGWLGYYVERNTQITALHIHQLGENENLLEPFCRGISRNRSIDQLELHSIEGGDLIRMLGPFIRNNRSLIEFTAYCCRLGAEGCRQLSLALGGCKRSSLKRVSLHICRINDDQFADIAVALSMHPKLESLVLKGNRIGRNGCRALATLLQWSSTNLVSLDLEFNYLCDEAIEMLAPALRGKLEKLSLSNNPSISTRGCRALAAALGDADCNLQTLNFRGNKVDDEVAIVFANALAKNQSLKELWIAPSSSTNNAITERGRAAFSKLICDTSSVNKTFLSNHTLTSIALDLGRDVKRVLAMNEMKVSKKKIAIIKILRHHRDLDMQPFFEWDFKVLPAVVDWFASTLERLDRVKVRSKSATAWEKIRRSMQPRKLSAIYQFVRGMPVLYVESRLRSQLEEAKSVKSTINDEQLKLRQKRLKLDLEQQELEQRERNVDEWKSTIIARLSG